MLPEELPDPTGCSTFTLFPTHRNSHFSTQQSFFSFGGTRKRGICKQPRHKYRHTGEALLPRSVNGLWDLSRVRRAVPGAHSRLSWKDGAPHINTP